MNRKILSLLVGTSTALLVACGGGGGGSSGSNGQANTGVGPNTIPGATGAGSSATTPSGNTITNTAVVATSVAINSVSTPPAPTYTGEELTVYNTFNGARTTCGFGPLKQNTALDASAYGHNYWLAVNNYAAHYQVANTPSFTGVAPLDRAINAGYSTLANFRLLAEVLASYTNTPKAGFGLAGARGLLSAPYHLIGIMASNREIGINVITSGPTGADITVAGVPQRALLASDMGATSFLLPQVQSATDVLTYPCAGVIGTAFKLTNESPNPIPSRNLATNPIGQPIFVRVQDGRTLVIASVSVTGPNGTIALEPTMTSANDPNGELTSNMAMIMPSTAMTPNTSYAVSITGTNGGTAFSRNFTFVTGN